MIRLKNSLHISAMGTDSEGKPGDVAGVAKGGTRRLIRPPVNATPATPVPPRSSAPKAARRRTGVGTVTVRRPEEQLQRSVVNLLAIYQSRSLLAFCHVPNGGRRSKAEAGTFKAMGVRAGVPDLLVWTQGGGHFAIELKTESGKLSPAQVAWHATITSLGHRVYVCRSVDDVERCLRTEAVLPIGTLATLNANARTSAGTKVKVPVRKKPRPKNTPTN